MNKKQLVITVIIAVVFIAIVVGVGEFTGRVAKAPEVSNIAVSTSTGEQATSTAITPTGTTTPSGSSATVTLQSHYVGSSFSLDYPNAWTITSMVPFSMDSFGGKYPVGGALPAGGVEVDIATTTAIGDLDSIMTTELSNALSLVTSTITVDAVACNKASFQANYAAGSYSQDTAIYCLRGNELWKIYFSYPVNDSMANAHISAFAGILNSMKFLP